VGSLILSTLGSFTSKSNREHFLQLFFFSAVEGWRRGISILLVPAKEAKEQHKRRIVEFCRSRLNATESIRTRAERLVVSLLGSRSAVGVVYQQDKRVELLSFGFLRFVVVVVVLGLQG
jgi:hypothetical protein